MPLAKLGKAQSRLGAKDRHRCGVSPGYSQANASSIRQAIGPPPSDRLDPQPRSAPACRSSLGPRARSDRRSNVPPHWPQARTRRWICVHEDSPVAPLVRAVLDRDHRQLPFGHTVGVLAGRPNEGEERNAVLRNMVFPKRVELLPDGFGAVCSLRSRIRRDKENRLADGSARIGTCQAKRLQAGAGRRMRTPQE